jgi:hypothetical protein
LIPQGFIHTGKPYDSQRNTERDNAGNISIGKTLCRDRIHPACVGYIHQKGVIEDIGTGKSDYGEYIQKNQNLPIPERYHRKCSRTQYAG